MKKFLILALLCISSLPILAVDRYRQMGRHHRYCPNCGRRKSNYCHGCGRYRDGYYPYTQSPYYLSSNVGYSPLGFYINMPIG